MTVQATLTDEYVIAKLCEAGGSFTYIAQKLHELFTFLGVSKHQQNELFALLNAMVSSGAVLRQDFTPVSYSSRGIRTCGARRVTYSVPC